MDFVAELKNYTPFSAQEEEDKGVILNFIYQNKETVLYRKNKIAHITSSGFILNPSLDKVLLIHHNIRDAWAWTGGHADGDGNLLGVALKEAREETGVATFTPLSSKIASVDILPVYGHQKNGSYVSAHLHLSVAYLLICAESEPLKTKPDENSGVKWFSTNYFTNQNFDPHDVYLYNKLIQKAKLLL